MCHKGNGIEAAARAGMLIDLSKHVPEDELEAAHR